MKVVLLSYSDSGGGASRACSRLHESFLGVGIDSVLLTVENFNNFSRIPVLNKYFPRFIYYLNRLVGLVFPASHPAHRSANFFGCISASFINNLKPDIVNIHWIGNGAISIKEISKIKSPVVVTMHDMWWFCGSEHLTHNFRYKSGYHLNGKIPDVDWFVFYLKKRFWKPMQLVVPSEWLKDCVKQSFLMKGWPVSVVPNALDFGVFKPVVNSSFKRKLSIPEDCTLVTFGAFNAISDENKGFRFIFELAEKYSIKKQVFFAVFGELPPADIIYPQNIKFLSLINTEEQLVELYSNSDIVVVPSIVESQSQVAVESLACGCPVVAFNTTGLRDVIEQKVNGYLSDSFNSDGLREGIDWLRENKIDKDLIRNLAYTKFSKDSVSKAYQNLFNCLLAKK